ncbi:MAG: arylsulfatase [Hyphomonas sp.]|nr:arylsulfatase [Hyphomonas sp.]
MSARLPASWILVFGLLVSACAAPPRAEQEAPRPNILIIVADDLGFSDLGSYGGEISTPNLDALADRGVRFMDFHTAPTCSPTRAMLFTGVDNHLAGVGAMADLLSENQRGQMGYEGELTERVASIAERVGDLGYRTFYSGKWHLGQSPGSDPSRRGFEESFILVGGGASHFSDRRGIFAWADPAEYRRNGVPVDQLPEDFYSSVSYADELIAYIDGGDDLDRPFLGVLALTAPHWPLQVLDEDLALYNSAYDEGYDVWRERRLANAAKLGVVPEGVTPAPRIAEVVAWESLSPGERAESARRMEIFAAMVDRMDREIGRVLAHLEAIGERENTIILFMSDNGPEGNNRRRLAASPGWTPDSLDLRIENFGKRNSYVDMGAGWGQVSAAPFSWFKSYPSEGGTRAPLIIAGPGIAPSGRIVSELTSVMDIAPTVLDAAGGGPGGSQMHGRSLWPLLQEGVAEGDAEDRVLAWELFGHRAVRRGPWKMVWLTTRTGGGEWKLFNMDRDPAEQDDLSAEYPEIVEQLLAEWDTYAETQNIVLPEDLPHRGFSYDPQTVSGE